MNKCCSFHQSQSSTSLCSRCCTVHRRHFPSIFPSPSRTATVLICLKLLQEQPWKLLQHVTTVQWKLSALISPKPPSFLTKPQRQGNERADILGPTHIHFRRDFPFFHFKRHKTNIILSHFYHKKPKKKRSNKLMIATKIQEEYLNIKALQLNKPLKKSC